MVDYIGVYNRTQTVTIVGAKHEMDARKIARENVVGLRTINSAKIKKTR